MFARLFAVASLAALAIAGPAPIAVRDQCNTNAINCCNMVGQASQVNDYLGQFGIVNALAGVTGLVGVGCSPISVIGTGSGAKCQQQPICCTDNKFNGLINVGCSPVNLGA